MHQITFFLIFSFFSIGENESYQGELSRIDCGSRERVEALRKEGSEIKYTEYPGVGHNSWVPAWSDQELIQWLFDQHISR